MISRFLCYCWRLSNNHPNTFFTRCTRHREFGKVPPWGASAPVNQWWASKHPPVVGVSRCNWWFKKCCKNPVSASPLSHRRRVGIWPLGLFSAVLNLFPAALAFSSLEQIKDCTLNCQQIEALMQTDKPVHVSMTQLKIQIYFHVWMHFKSYEHHC